MYIYFIIHKTPFVVITHVRFPQKYFYKNFSHFINNNLILKIDQRFISKRMDKQIMIYSCNEII